MPASSAMRASRRLSGHESDQRSGTSVTARPDEQFGPNKPIFSALALYMLMRSRMDAWGASNGRPSVGRGATILHARTRAVNAGQRAHEPPGQVPAAPHISRHVRSLFADPPRSLRPAQPRGDGADDAQPRRARRGADAAD